MGQQKGKNGLKMAFILRGPKLVIGYWLLVIGYWLLVIGY
jgi:predicted tellurium resistance membrane protein TerC